MKYLLLPGNSKHNYKWAKELKKDISKHGITLSIVSWNHWEQGGSFKMRPEIDKVKSRFDETGTVLICKSVGTRLTARLISENPEIQPVFMVFLGVPSTNEVYEKFFRDIDPAKLVIIQNDHDPYVNYRELKEFVDGINPRIRILKGDRSDHSYPYPDLIAAEVLKTTATSL